MLQLRLPAVRSVHIDPADEADALFAALGFRLTRRGRHSLGSVNHLMMTPGAYLELVGVPEDGPQRRDVLDSPFGLNGLVLASRDADATAARLAQAGLPAGPPTEFSRPVVLGDRMEEARFRTVRLPPGLFPAGRVYHCQHLTPELVWRSPWFEHPNGFCGIGALTVESPDPDAEATRYAAACGVPAARSSAGWRIPLGTACIEVRPGPVARYASLDLRFASLATIEARARALPEVGWDRTSAEAAELVLPAFDLRLGCGCATRR